MALPLSTPLVVGKQYTFEFLPNSILDVVINTWALEARLQKDWGIYASIDSVKIVGTIAVTITPGTPGGTVQSWVNALKWSIDSHLTGSSSFVKAEGGGGSSFLDPILKPIQEAPGYILKLGGIVLGILVVVVVLQSGALKGVSRG